VNVCYAGGVSVTVGEHTSICTVYDFTVHPVSVHLPLTRLLASLFIWLDEPVEVSICQGDHLSGKPGNVREFETCQRNVRDVVNSQGIVREMSGKKSCHGKVSQNCSLPFISPLLRKSWLLCT